MGSRADRMPYDHPRSPPNPLVSLPLPGFGFLADTLLHGNSEDGVLA
jgi:hypothetical protein